MFDLPIIFIAPHYLTIVSCNSLRVTSRAAVNHEPSHTHTHTHFINNPVNGSRELIDSTRDLCTECVCVCVCVCESGWKWASTNEIAVTSVATLRNWRSRTAGGSGAGLPELMNYSRSSHSEYWPVVYLEMCDAHKLYRFGVRCRQSVEKIFVERSHTLGLENKSVRLDFHTHKTFSLALFLFCFIG